MTLGGRQVDEPASQCVVTLAGRTDSEPETTGAGRKMGRRIVGPVTDRPGMGAGQPAPMLSCWHDRTPEARLVASSDSQPMGSLSGSQGRNHIAVMEDFLNFAFAFGVTFGGVVALSLLFWFIDKGQE